MWQVYLYAAQPIVKSIIEGYNGTVFAYGQTGSGKTHTMIGPPGDPGLIPRLCQGLFSEPGLSGWTVHLSYFEIYNEQVVDLLGESAPSSGTEERKTPPPGSSAGVAGGDAVAKQASTQHKWVAAGLDPKRRAPLRVREHAKLGVYVEGLSQAEVAEPQQVLDIVAASATHRATVR